MIKQAKLPLKASHCQTKTHKNLRDLDFCRMI